MPQDYEKNDSTAPLSLYFGFLVKKYTAALMHSLSHLEADRSFVLLSVIEQSGEPITQQRLADYCKIDKASMTRIMDYLVRQGLVGREVNPDDRREYFIVLTARGKALVPDIQARIRNLNKAAFRHLTLRQKKHFFAILETIEHNLEELPAEEVFFQLPTLPRKKGRSPKGPSTRSGELSEI